MLKKETCGKASKVILSGIVLLAYGIFAILIALTFGVLVIIFAGGIIAYGVFKSREIPTELTVDKVLMERERIEADPALKKSVDAEKLYNELLTRYVYRWGALRGTALLGEEIGAFLRQGFSFSEAVRKIHARTRT